VVDAPSFDIAEHVGVFPVAPPGTDTPLLLACEELRRRPLKRSRPLWEMWLLPGLPQGRVGLFMRLHHAIADGVAGVAVLGAFVDTVAEPREATAPAWNPASMPSRRTLLADNVRRRLHGTGHALSALAEPINTVRRVQQGWPALREIFAEGRAPRTSFNVGSARIGGWRSSAAISISPRRSHTLTVPRSTTCC
jgi:diacylglycerol O-acyltransferase